MCRYWIGPFLALLLVRPATLQDNGAPPVEESECRKPNGCHTKHSSTTVKCPDCNRTSIPDCNKLCTDCAKKKNVCKLCGRELPAKPGFKPKNIDEAIRLLKAADIQKIAMYLASDELEGRCAGYPGEQKAVEYITKIYKDAGLKPVGDGGGYTQAFTASNGRKTQNTLALLEGSDPKLKKEVVIVGGHHDHVGRGNQHQRGQLAPPTQQDDIYNGADDNASGASTVAALAAAFGKSGLKPKRSILFMTFSGEEWGLDGSRHYVGSPVFPLSDTIAMINLDMIGRNGDKPVGIYGLGTEEGQMFEQIVGLACQKTGLNAKPNQGTNIGAGDSDHSSFKNRNIPVIFFFSGFHGDYHRPSDHPNKLDYLNLERIGRATMVIAWELANARDRPAFSSK